MGSDSGRLRQVFAPFDSAASSDPSMFPTIPSHASHIAVSLTPYGVPRGAKARECRSIQAHSARVTRRRGVRFLRGHKTAVQ